MKILSHVLQWMWVVGYKLPRSVLYILHPTTTVCPFIPHPHLKLDTCIMLLLNAETAKVPNFWVRNCNPMWIQSHSVYAYNRSGLLSSQNSQSSTSFLCPPVWLCYKIHSPISGTVAIRDGVERHRVQILKTFPQTALQSLQNLLRAQDGTWLNHLFHTYE